MISDNILPSEFAAAFYYHLMRFERSESLSEEVFNMPLGSRLNLVEVSRLLFALGRGLSLGLQILYDLFSDSLPRGV